MTEVSTILLTPMQGLFELSLLNAEKSEAAFEEVILEGVRRGIPVEILTRLKDLWEVSKNIAGEVIAIGKIIVLTIIDFLKANPSLTVGLLLGAAVSSLVLSIPFLGPILAPLSMLIASLYGAGVGASVQNGDHSGSPLTAAISLANKFLELLMRILKAISQHWSESKEDLDSVIEKLKGKDKVGFTGEILSTAAGAVAGIAGASTIASAAGATTLLGSTSLASALGGLFVATTPVGWVIGCAVAIGAAGYGITKLVRSGSRQDQVREELVKRFQTRLKALEKNESNQSPLDDLRQLLPSVIDKGLISEAQAERMIGLIERGVLDAEIALQRINSLLIV